MRSRRGSTPSASACAATRRRPRHRPCASTPRPGSIRVPVTGFGPDACRLAPVAGRPRRADGGAVLHGGRQREHVAFVPGHDTTSVTCGLPRSASRSCRRRRVSRPTVSRTAPPFISRPRRAPARGRRRSPPASRGPGRRGSRSAAVPGRDRSRSCQSARRQRRHGCNAGSRATTIEGVYVRLNRSMKRAVGDLDSCASSTRWMMRAIVLSAPWWSPGPAGPPRIDRAGEHRLAGPLGPEPTRR